MSTLKEMSIEYLKAAAKLRLCIRRWQKRGANQSEVLPLRNALRDVRETARELNDYYGSAASVSELKTRRAELCEQRKKEQELMAAGLGDNMALFFIEEEILDIDSRLRSLGAKPNDTRQRKNNHKKHGGAQDAEI